MRNAPLDIACHIRYEYYTRNIFITMDFTFQELWNNRTLCLLSMCATSSSFIIKINMADYDKYLCTNILQQLIAILVSETSVELPESKSMRVENKMFYFDIGQNNRGTYMRISEVSLSSAYEEEEEEEVAM